MRISGFCIGFFLLSCCLEAQQDTGMITGQVTDATGSAIPSARVLLVNTGTNVQTSVLTNSDGLFVAAPLRIGVYTVAVEAKGFKKAVRDNITLRVQDRLPLDFQLEVGDVAESVQVVAETPILQSETSSLGQVIVSKPVSELPLNGRNFISHARRESRDPGRFTATNRYWPRAQAAGVAAHGVLFKDRLICPTSRRRDGSLLIHSSDESYGLAEMM